MKAQNKFIIAVLTTLLTTAGINTASYAAPSVDGKIFPGNMCQPTNGNQAERFITHYWGIHNKNDSTAPMAVTCPIVRDNTLNDSGLEIVQVRVKNSAAGDLSCVLASFTKFSIQPSTYSAVTHQPGNQELSLKVDKSEPGGGAYALYCILPPGAKLWNYWVKEFAPTDPN